MDWDRDSKTVIRGIWPDAWICHDPVFACDAVNPDLLEFSPWSGHRRFAYDYVRNVRPAVIAELGTFYGCSAFAFQQAILDGGLDTVFTAVDTWQGDAFTREDYREPVREAYEEVQRTCYADVHARSLCMRFDEAAGLFPDGSVDLLHIDGSHRYEDVSHDYRTWKDKISPRGAAFFHDVGRDLLLGRETGSSRFWRELKRDHPLTLEFSFSCGLGILFTDRELYTYVRDSIPPGLYQQYVNLQDTISKDRLRRQHFELRSLRRQKQFLEESIRALEGEIGRYRETVSRKDAWIRQLEQQAAGVPETEQGRPFHGGWRRRGL